MLPHIHYTDDRSNPFQVWCDEPPQEHLYPLAGDAGSGGGGYALRGRFRGIHYTDDRSNAFRVWYDAQPQEHLYAPATPYDYESL